ncbi:uncharacterized protein LOC119381202 [Rhipicephalus sanguineus]|uniref:uncharacterized protein LOC119381202 n=1 Tax=Rhipicephalus sanguineus TaxID=34632 RepID=UPI001893CCFA|nr:uncharacterized protein LOC119381202 [Rhipicephalus sanguineus]
MVRPVPSSFGFSVVAKAERLLLQARINNCRDDIRKLENEAFFARRHLEFHCPDHFVSIQLYANHQAKLRSLEAEDAHEVKLARLSGSTKPRRPEGSTVTVHNLSTYRLDPAESSVLELGLNFNTGPASDVRRVICAAENAVNQVHQSHRDEARTRVVGVLSRLRQRKFPSPLSADERGAIKRLRENGEIVILPADKGNATVVLDTAVYKRKMLDLLEDQDTYIRLTRDPTLKVQKELQKLLSDVFRFVPPEHKGLYYSLLCHNGSAPALYGLPKIHKPDVPLRPIVDFTRSPLHKLSGYLHRMLSPLVGQGNTHVRNSAHFVEKIGSLVFDEDEVMVSFGVVSLFTSIPTDLAVESCAAALEADPHLAERSPFDVPDLRKLLSFCLANTYFSFDKVFYKQVHGAPMGASVSVTAANLTMEWLENRALASFSPSPRIFLRYVDDCFCVIERSALEAFTAHLNNQSTAIQFTVEMEANQRLPFLDVLVKRTNGALSFSVYRKGTHTGRYLNFKSVHPDTHKRSVVASLLGRANRLCTNPEDLNADVKMVREDLSTCGYRQRLLMRWNIACLLPHSLPVSDRENAQLFLMCPE